MRINSPKAMIETAAWGAAVLLLGAGAATAQQQINLAASGTGLVLPDGTRTPMWGYFCGTAGRRPKPPPRLIVSMTLRLAIPWRVGLHQSPPPLHQPKAILEENKLFE